ncbi:transcriptional regulator, TetR family protein [Paenibacillus vortex V453]|jgi:AcrR family transcriptional regulator|uniref:TetR family transcriptional regulator n=2 Tax=Paenibacillus TaxID=44249 RepID=A0A163IA82_9BACL|nr:MULTISPECIES: TetR/AcrR family transcriptional regulator [Paenibacillus]ANA79839.1 TetR family transcriptional regulator [Paenibacillus glucanolyticus]AVV56136.1 TetR/AcrR family transcriptional regulator [Paenibacillus glucanolyticus]AWP30673.1 TetR family transcriptional regulator [Paenibacillus sp. Cedars]EFU38076.1 transcriptional regulator, TetR family protein [Paenibacillus vortex V453]ETT38217.1 TetR family transcriptional regulator [Paenibacillus sp. FSL R5-808]
MSAANIKQSALAHFAKNGYEGASLKHIADDCGIKKPSIYAHFSSKEDLFLQVLQDVFQRQEKLMVGYFLNHTDLPLEQQLHGFLENSLQAYQGDDEVRFFMRMAFFPPSTFYDEVMAMLYPLLDEQENNLSRLLAAGCPVHGRIIRYPRKAAIAFMTLLDGIHLEAVYGGEERALKRLTAAWPIFWLGVTKQSSNSKS